MIQFAKNCSNKSIANEIEGIGVRSRALRAILRDYENMSSSTILFVLEALMG